jgi:hypothetical protein
LIVVRDALDPAQRRREWLRVRQSILLDVLEQPLGVEFLFGPFAATQPPEGRCDALHQLLLERPDRLQVVADRLVEFLELVCVLAGEKDGLCGDAVLERIQASACLPGLCPRPGGTFGVLAVRVDARLRRRPARRGCLVIADVWLRVSEPG